MTDRPSSPDTTTRSSTMPPARSAAAVEALLGSSSQPAALHDVGGRVVEVNESFARLLGTDAGALVDLGLDELVHPSDRDPARSAFAAACSGPSTAPVGLRLAHADGAWTYVECAATSLRDERGVAGILVRASAPTDVPSQTERVAALAQGIAKGYVGVTFEPIACLRSGLTHGADAIARWRTPGRPERRRDDFTSLAETSGLIGALGESIVDQVLQGIAQAGDGANASVTLPGRWLRDDHLTDDVARLMMRHGVLPHRISFLVTEGTAISDVRSTVATLDSLRELGCPIGLDELGTTVATSSLLDGIRPDVVKLGRGMVGRVLHDLDAITQVGTLLHLAKELDLVTIAKGVDNREQAVWLSDLGCDQVQGRYVGVATARPVDPAQHDCEHA